MAVPKFDEMYNEYLAVLSDGTPKTRKEIRGSIAKILNLTPEDLSATYSSGAPIFNGRVSWTESFLLHAGLIQRTARGVYSITPEGKKLLDAGTEVNNKLLNTIPSFRNWDNSSKKANDDLSNGQNSDTTPEESIETAMQELNAALADQLMEEIMSHDPTFFEHLVVQLLQNMGYGGSVPDSGIVTQKSNDGGIDGIIRQDELGFDQIYIQAKRWDPDTSVGRPEIHKFSGALQDKGASKGLFITTAKFSEGARASADKQHIVLVDGERLTKLMIKHNLGVSTFHTYEIKKLDTDFFNEDD